MKPKFKLQIEDRDKATGEYLFQPTYHEHHRSYLRNHFIPEQFKQEMVVRGLRNVVFYGVQGQIVSEEDTVIIK